MNSHIGEQIKEIRDKTKLSQERFGKKIGLSGKSISAYETGKANPPLRVLENISEAYDAHILGLNKQKKDLVTEKVDFIRTELEYLKNILTEI